jgi:hypothetical protein
MPIAADAQADLATLSPLLRANLEADRVVILPRRDVGVPRLGGRRGSNARKPRSRNGQ